MAGTQTSATSNTSNHANLSNNTSDKIIPCNIGNVVLVKGEKIIGVVQYKGTVEWDTSNRPYIGLTLSDPVPNGHDGTARGRQYFKCPDKHGIIISSHLVSRKISGGELLQKVTALNNAFKQCYNQSQELQRKYMEIRATLHSVQGENQTLRERLTYYESRTRDPHHDSPYISQSRSPSPSPNTIRTRSKSNHTNSSHRRQNFASKALPPLPPNKIAKSVPTSPFFNDKMTPMFTNEEDPQSYGLPTPSSINIKTKKRVRHKKRESVYRRRRNSNETFKSFKSRSHKSSYKSRKSSFKSRKSSFKSRTTKSSFKSRRNRNQSDMSRTTMTSTVCTTTDRCQDSPMPLSIGDHMGGTIKMLIPNINTPKMLRSYSTNTLDILNDTGHENDESESHDYQDSLATRTTSISHYDDDGDIIDEEDELFNSVNRNTSVGTSSTSISTRHTNTPKSYSTNYGQRFISKFVPRDVEDVDDDDVLSGVLYNEADDLELGSVGASMQNIYQNSTHNIISNDDIFNKVPGIINENHEMNVPHIVEEEDVSSDADIINDQITDVSDSESIEFVTGYEQLDEDNNLEIETPEAIHNDVEIKMYKPQKKKSESNNSSNSKNKHIVDTHKSKPLPPLMSTQKQEPGVNNNNLNANVHSVQYSGSVQSALDNIGLYPDHNGHTDQRSNLSGLLSDTQSSARYSNTPSYTHTATTMASNNISPPKKRDFKKRLSHTPASIRIPGKFNPGKKFSSVPAHRHDNLADNDDMQMDSHNNGVFAAQDILNNMDNHHTQSETHSMNSSHSNSNHGNGHFRISPPQQMHLVNMFEQNNIGNFHNMVKRKTIGGSCLTLTNTGAKKTKPKKVAKKRIIRSRTFVSTTSQGQKYNCLEQAKELDKSTILHQRAATPEIDFVEQKSHQPVPSPNNTPIMRPTTPKTMPLNAVEEPSTSHQMTLDDFELDHALDTDLKLSQHNSHKHSRASHQQYYSQHINLEQRKNLPPSTPTFAGAKSERKTVAKKNFYRKRAKTGGNGHNLSQINTHVNRKSKVKGKDTRSGSINDTSPHRNLGSLTHHELKGLLEADNLFTYDNYQKIVQ